MMYLSGWYEDIYKKDCAEDGGSSSVDGFHENSADSNIRSGIWLRVSTIKEILG